MHLVKGVANLIRGSSGGNNSESASGLQTERFTLPAHNVCFSEVGNESILKGLWEKYEKAADKVEKRKLFRVFLKQFVDVHNNWEPIITGECTDSTSSTVSDVEQSFQSGDTSVGCFSGHPTEFIITLIDEITQMTSIVTDLDTGFSKSTYDSLTVSTSLKISTEGIPALEALVIIVRSVHNCRILGYYGGIQKLVALIKAAVVQLKAIAGALAGDEALSDHALNIFELLQKLLVHVVSILCSFIDLNSDAYEMANIYNSITFSLPSGGASLIDPSATFKVQRGKLYPWKKTAIVSVMEAGGLNWLVELLRVMRRLSIKEQWTNLSLQYLTLRALHSALSENSRAQNHFRSIGGLEVLLDGLGLPSSNALASKAANRYENILLALFQLHVLSLEVLREAVYGNVNNMQFLCENGRVHNFANSFCIPAFALQNFELRRKEISVQSNLECLSTTSEHDNEEKIWNKESSTVSLAGEFIKYWQHYAFTLSQSFCSFMVAFEDTMSESINGPTGRHNVPVSSLFSELSVRWLLRVLLIVFPCIKAFSNQDELPAFLRMFVCILQHQALHALRQFLSSLPTLLEVFRAERIWELVFSENFFGAALLDFEVDCSATKGSCLSSVTIGNDIEVLVLKAESLKMEVISFAEFAATLKETTHNLPECSALLDALERSARNPEIATVLCKSLLQILQHAREKTLASFKELKGMSRVLRVACIQAQEFRSNDSTPSEKLTKVDDIPPDSCHRSDIPAALLNLDKSMGSTVELFNTYFCVADDAKSLVHDAECIDCLFDLFWDKDLRNLMLGYILELMKAAPSCKDDQSAKLQLCSRYLETFTQVKEKEKDFAEVSIELLAGMRAMLLMDQEYYQELFRNGECFIHVVSLLNGVVDSTNAEKLVLDVLQTLTSLLSNNDISKASFRNLVGRGYQTLQSLLLEYCHSQASECLLNSLLDMLVDGKFDVKGNPSIKNEDAIILYLSLLQESSDSVQQAGLNIFLQLLRDSISNRASCVSAGMLNFLLDWFSKEDNDNVILRIAQLIQVIGGHSISGRDIRKIFMLLRSEKVGKRQQYCSLLMNCILAMLNEKGPTAFFDLVGDDSGIILRTPLQWPLNRGFTFSCWLRVENFPRCGTMGLFSFLTENGRGCFSLISKDKLIYESINQKRHGVSFHVNLARKKWHYLCITHSIGRAFSGGSLLKCYLDGNIVSSEKCRYPKVNDPLTKCAMGTKILLPFGDEENTSYSIKDISPFLGQIGPVYLFNDAITSEQVMGIFSLGPSYMYSFLDNEFAPSSDSPLPGGIFDTKDGLAPKIIFGLNAQASNKRALYNVAPLMEYAVEKNPFEATVLAGTQLCSRRLLQEIIYCVGGISVFFPLFTQSHYYENEEQTDNRNPLLIPITKERLTAEVIELIAFVLDENVANQQQMHLVSGCSILGFLLQSVPPEQLNLETLSALKHLFNVIANCGLSELLIKDAISAIFLNPLVWVFTVYKVQRELYMFLIQQFDNDPRLLKSLCRLPRVLDIIRQFYWDNAKCRSSGGWRPLMRPLSKKTAGERPSKEEIQKIRLLLLSLGEMSLRQCIDESDIRALVAFFEISQDMACVEDVLHMVIRAISQKSLMAPFVEQVNSIGGCHVFINLLQRANEPIRLLSLQFIGRLLVGIPSEKKGLKIFNIAVGRSKSLSEINRRTNSRIQPTVLAISERLFSFPLTEHLCATLFDVLLGGASPKQVVQKQTLAERQKSKGNSSQFFVPQVLALIFKFLSECKDVLARVKIITDLLDLLDSSPSNIESLMEYGWTAWLTAAMELDVVKHYKLDSVGQSESEIIELNSVRTLFCVVLCYYLFSVKGGWQHLEETVNFILMHFEKQAGVSYHYLLRDIFEDLLQKLIEFSREENVLASQPCRDNTLYFMKLIDELLLSEIDHKLPFPATSTEFSPDQLDVEGFTDLGDALHDALQGESVERMSRNPSANKLPTANEDVIADDNWWSLYDCLWVVISEMNGKGPGKTMPKSTSFSGPSLGQRARGLVESLNIPAAEMAAVVVSGGLGNALGGKSSKNVDKAMLLRGEKCPRVVFRLVILYLCRASLQRASRGVQQVIPLLPSLFLPDDEQSRNRLQLFIWSLLAVRYQYGMLDDGNRFHVISHLIRETVNGGKSLLATSINSGNESSDPGTTTAEMGAVHNLIQKDRVLIAASDEAKFIKDLKTDHMRQLLDLQTRIDENTLTDSGQKKAFEDELQSTLRGILALDESRRAAFQLACDEEQQVVADKWMHVFRYLIDERGPWSANPFPNCVARHWKLDKTEDAWRRRLKLRQNYHFDEKLCYPSSNVSENEAAVVPCENNSGAGVPIPEQMKRLLLKGIRRITDEVNPEASESDNESSDSQGMNSEEVSDGQFSELLKDGEQKDAVHERKESSSPTFETDSGQALMTVPCIMVTPKRKLAGHLAVLKNVLHFFGEYLVEGTAGSTVFRTFESFKNSESETTHQSNEAEKLKFLKIPTDANIISEKHKAMDTLEKQMKGIKRHWRWEVSKIKAVHWTRYLLQYTAVEIFFSNSVAPVFFNFSSQKMAKDVGSLIVVTRNELLFPKGSTKDRTGVISFVDRRLAQEMAETARESWRKREITNFEYLMILNTLAGRSYNDLTQYPVFPWVLADYTSETLDYNKSSTFRDLSKPVGALDPKRFEVFEDRYQNFSDPDIPSFYYGSHYSSMGSVLYYLIRLEPFTALHRNLQGGKFDHADRLFQSIEGTFRNCLSNTSDVKELVPEFFYMPEFLVNSNSYHLGVKQDGELIGDVCLPPWAKRSAEEFIYRNREALESEFVSSNLHLWIDLIFGYKQRGKPAVEAANIFYYLTYEGAVDLEIMEDELQRSAIEDQIANFGQTPIQIFRKKHPRRGPPIPIAQPLRFAPGSINLTSIVSSFNHSPSALLYVNVFDSNVILVNQGLTMSVKTWLTTQLQSGGNFTFSGSQDPFFEIGSDVLPPRNIGSSLAETAKLGAQCFATLQTPSENFLVSCGNWDNSFQLVSLSDGRVVQSIRRHKDVVSSVAVSSEGSILATGSYDTTIMVWEVCRSRTVDKRVRSSQSDIVRKDYVISETPFHILCGHDDIITCLYVSMELDIVISGSKDGTCVFHTLREGRYVRSLRHPSGSALTKLVVSRHGRIVLYSDDDLSLHLYSINGKHIASLESYGRLSCIKLSACGDFLVCAGDQGQIVLRSMNSLEVVKKYPGIGKVITSLTVTPEECFLAGTKEGNLLVYSIENPQQRRGGGLPRNIKSKSSVAG
ncbi:BEACH domain-containing protein B-like isoform X1 [Chenopodium quinoa]|uniref:BEACH domain-containing protein B-like isoform X1 n=2 Tax=Chenopodium quinoa TaxID=63459 RepID=UPI000B774DB7|nr:BEACH domain-containing protein B-like isoform X1 [Chenopodium quinoa]XP_021759770.1 BEACH domain-containing protein B-like isoform X1 [Chenopodium quinoa]